MSKKISLVKKIKLYNQYRKIIKNNKSDITDINLNLRLDRINRLYSVVNMPDEVKTYGTSLSEKYLKEYISKCDKMFNKIGLSELIGILDISKIDEQNYLVVFGFSLMDISKFYTRIIIFILIAILLSLPILL